MDTSKVTYYEKGDIVHFVANIFAQYTMCREKLDDAIPHTFLQSLVTCKQCLKEMQDAHSKRRSKGRTGPDVHTVRETAA